MHAATFADDVLCLTFSGLSKAYRVAGYRAGWVVVTGARHRAADFLEGLTLLANMRLCPNVPAQHAIQTALGGHQSINDLVLPGGRLLDQRDAAHTLLNEIPGVTCVKPQGALYVFPRLDPEVYPIEDDEAFVLDLLRARRSWSPTAPASTGPRPTTCGSSPCRRGGPHPRHRTHRRLPGNPPSLTPHPPGAGSGCSDRDSGHALLVGSMGIAKSIIRQTQAVTGVSIRATTTPP